MDEVILSPEKIMEKKEYLKRKSAGAYDANRSIEREKMVHKSKSLLDVQ
jgi:hypothetical protein